MSSGVGAQRDQSHCMDLPFFSEPLARCKWQLTQLAGETVLPQVVAQLSHQGRRPAPLCLFKVQRFHGVRRAFSEPNLIRLHSLCEFLGFRHLGRPRWWYEKTFVSLCWADPLGI